MSCLLQTPTPLLMTGSGTWVHVCSVKMVQHRFKLCLPESSWNTGWSISLLPCCISFPREQLGIVHVCCWLVKWPESQRWWQVLKYALGSLSPDLSLSYIDWTVLQPCDLLSLFQQRTNIFTPITSLPVKKYTLSPTWNQPTSQSPGSHSHSQCPPIPVAFCVAIPSYLHVVSNYLGESHWVSILYHI